MIIYNHMRNIEKDYSQVKKDRELVEIRERFSKLDRLIQQSNGDEYYGWVMKRKRVQWFALQ